MPEYRKVKERFPTMLEMVKDSLVAAEITLQPMRAFPLDAAIIFSDILIVLEAMGLPLRFVKGEGPVFDRAVRTGADIESLAAVPPEEAHGYTLEAIRLVKRELGMRVPLIGFAGAPFTLACYAVEGGPSREYTRVKALMHADFALWSRLMDRIAAAVSGFLRAQAEAGADALQLFDSWAGILSPPDYERFALPWVQRIIRHVRGCTDVPLVYFGTGTAGLLHLIARSGADMIGVDWRINLEDGWKLIGAEHAIQGNLDPALLFAEWPAIERAAREILRRAGGRPGHVFNLGHGILEHTPVDNVRRLAEFVRGQSGV
jgi:uroporphyrinogen decarboxylase